MRGLAFAFLLASASLALASNAKAEDDSLRTPTVTKVRTRYGRQTLLCDMGALGIVGSGLFTAAETQSTALANTVLINGGALFLLGGPIVHLAHRHPVRALLTFGLRAIVIGAPLAWGIPMYERERRLGANGDEQLAVYATVLPMALGFGAVTALDSALFTRETKTISVEPTAASKPIFMPGFAFVRGGATAGVHGLF